eukprot:984068-Prorocentrum_minimum.AAC.1
MTKCKYVPNKSLANAGLLNYTSLPPTSLLSTEQEAGCTFAGVPGRGRRGGAAFPLRIKGRRRPLLRESRRGGAGGGDGGDQGGVDKGVDNGEGGARSVGEAARACGRRGGAPSAARGDPSGTGAAVPAGKAAGEQRGAAQHHRGEEPPALREPPGGPPRGRKNK